MKSLHRSFTATALAALALLAVCLTAAPAYAQGPEPEGPQGAAPLVDSAVPQSGQLITWAAFQGAPPITTGSIAFWVWNENVSGQNILHIRTTTDGQSHQFTGTVSTGVLANFYKLALVNGDGDDSANLVSYNRLTFALTSSGDGEGVDVDWSGRWVSLDLYVDGAHQPLDVHYGAAATTATSLPLNVAAGRAGLLQLPLALLDGPTAFQKNIADGYFLYHNATGYHLRVTTTSVTDVVVYRGTINSTGGQIKYAALVRPEGDDYYRLVGGTALSFSLKTFGGEDGLNWTTTGGGMIMALRMNGVMAAPNITLGSQPFGTVQAYTFYLAP